MTGHENSWIRAIAFKDSEEYRKLYEKLMKCTFRAGREKGGKNNLPAINVNLHKEG